VVKWTSDGRDNSGFPAGRINKKGKYNSNDNNNSNNNSNNKCGVLRFAQNDKLEAKALWR
jgi:hypothetical protein